MSGRTERTATPRPPRMWDEERQSPWLLLVYALAIAVSLAASALLAD